MAKKNPDKGKELEEDYFSGRITLDQYLSCKVPAATPAPTLVGESPEKVVKDYMGGKIKSFDEYNKRFSKVHRDWDFLAMIEEKSPFNPKPVGIFFAAVITIGLANSLINSFNKSNPITSSDYAIVKQVAESMNPYYSHPEGYTIEERRAGLELFIDNLGKASETIPSARYDLAEIVEDLDNMQTNTMLLNDPEAYGVLLEHYHGELIDILP